MKLKEAINYCKDKVEEEFKLSHKAKNVIKKISANLRMQDLALGFECTKINWSNKEEYQDIHDTDSNTVYKENFEVIGKPFLGEGNNSRYLGEIKLDFALFILFDKSENAISYYFLDKTEVLFHDVEILLKGRISELSLKSYFSNEIKVEGEELLGLFLKINRKHSPNKILITDDFDFYHDLARVNESIRYGLAFANTYSYYLTEFAGDPAKIGDKILWRYFPTYNDRYYHFYIETIFTNYVTFWDRATTIFKPLLGLSKKEMKKNFYFSKLIEILRKDETISKYEEFEKVNSFYEEFFLIKERRNEIIHEISLQSNFFHDYAKSNTSREELEKLDEQLFNLYNDLKNFYEVSYTAFYHYLKLIDKIY